MKGRLVYMTLATDSVGALERVSLRVASAFARALEPGETVTLEAGAPVIIGGHVFLWTSNV